MLLVVRHGRTAWNAAHRFQGWADVLLDEEGRRQSQRAGADVAAELGNRPVAVVSSDLRRAVETAGAIASALGVPTAVDRDLREVDVGRWEGLTLEEAKARFPDEYVRWAAGEDVRRGGGETLSEAGERVATAILNRWTVADDLVVVGHGMSLQAAVGRLAQRGVVALAGPAPHLGNAEHLVLQDSRHDQNKRVLSEQ